jgi:hypothetical protein
MLKRQPRCNGRMVHDLTRVRQAEMPEKRRATEALCMAGISPSAVECIGRRLHSLHRLHTISDSIGRVAVSVDLDCDDGRRRASSVSMDLICFGWGWLRTGIRMRRT